MAAQMTQYDKRKGPYRGCYRGCYFLLGYTDGYRLFQSLSKYITPLYSIQVGFNQHQSGVISYHFQRSSVREFHS